MNDTIPLLSTARLRERRLAAGLSQRQLANALGVRSVLILRLERGKSHASLPLHRVVALANMLGTTVDEMLAEPPDAAPGADEGSCADDASTLCGLLAELNQMVGRDELAEALDWPLDRLHAAARGLRARLAGSGLYLQSTWGLRLRANPQTVDADLAAKVELAGAARRGLNLSTAGLLYRTAHGEADVKWEHHASNPERVTMGALLRMGLVEKTGAGYIVSDDVAYSLGLAR